MRPRQFLLCVVVAATSALRTPRPRASAPWPRRSRAAAAAPPLKRFAAVLRRRRAWLLRAALYVATVLDAAYSVQADSWAALRLRRTEASGIIDRRRRAQKISHMTGIGYSPRVVAFAGLMLRALTKSTGMPLGPSIGFGVGSNLAAKWARREWLPCLVLGWYAGGPYWDTLDVRPAEGFGGVPIWISGVRLGG